MFMEYKVSGACVSVGVYVEDFGVCTGGQEKVLGTYGEKNFLGNFYTHPPHFLILCKFFPHTCNPPTPIIDIRSPYNHQIWVSTQERDDLAW